MQGAAEPSAGDAPEAKDAGAHAGIGGAGRGGGGANREKAREHRSKGRAERLLCGLLKYSPYSFPQFTKGPLPFVSDCWDGDSQSHLEQRFWAHPSC